MNSLDEINAILDDDFEERFNFDDIIIDYTNAADAIQDFFKQFIEYYNTDKDYIDLGEIKPLLNFDKTMKICKYIAEQYEERGLELELLRFDDHILKIYIFFYMLEHHENKYESQIEEYFAQREEAEWELPEEEEEPEPELPPAQ